MKTKYVGPFASRMRNGLLAVAGLTMVGAVASLGSGGEGHSVGDNPATGNDPLILKAIDMEARLAALAEREELRAYFGAPPVIPHEIDQLDSEADCMTCHAEPENPQLPHARLASCTQCHVIQENDLFIETDGAGNSFSGLEEPVGGSRAWQGAPPTIPHSTLMRDRCLSCHGPDDHEGLRSSHPERLSCRQCHASSAMLNQHLASEAAAMAVLAGNS